MLQQAQKYPIGVQSFRVLREEGYVYVDKTAILYTLVSRGKSYFLSRPRRFGKSLTLSTLESYFLGEKELFKGLAMEKLEQDWHRHPVFHLDLSAYRQEGPDILKAILDQQFASWEKTYGIEPGPTEPTVRFRNLIEEAHRITGRRVAILIDEYDAPMIAHMDDEPRLKEVRDMLRSIYMNIKICDQHIQFTMITGVSRFSKLSVFSGLNNLNDISLDAKYSEICGITEQELKSCFRPGIESLAAKLGLDFDGALDVLKENYDGYHFTEDCPDIYNPFSLLQAFEKEKIGSYWYASGRATLIVKRINEMSGYLSKILNEEEANATMLTEVESYKTDPVALLFQAGYLTIKEFDSRYNVFTLGVPNKEVRQGLLTDIANNRFSTSSGSIETKIWSIRRLLDAGDPDEALEVIRTFMSRVPYDIMPDTPEIYFENNLYLIFSLVGIDVRAEWRHSAGRVDMLLVMDSCIYVMELKLDGSAEQALKQIEEKGYALPFADDSRRVFRIGINFSKQTRNIDSWIIKEK